jgi:hypothetical protein
VGSGDSFHTPISAKSWQDEPPRTACHLPRSSGFVNIGSGTDGRDVVTVTGVVVQFRLPGMGVVFMEAGQFIFEAFGPNDPNMLPVSEVGR